MNFNSIYFPISLGSIFDNTGLSKLSLIFRVIMIVIIYLIIFYALRIMYKDIKNGGKKQVKKKKNLGLEVIDSGMSNNLRMGSVIPILREVTIGRKEDNTVILSENYVSGHHARIFLRNTDYIIEDLNSTNGTLLNGDKIKNKVYLRPGDEIKIGTIVFKVIG